MTKAYTEEDIAAHNKKGDLWIAIGDSVYNITDFIVDHPGGEEILLDVGGRNASKDFEDVGHSPDAHDMMKKYKVGDFKGSSQSKTKKAEPAKPAQPSTTVSKAQLEESSNKVIFVPLLILLIALVAYFTLGAY